MKNRIKITGYIWADTALVAIGTSTTFCLLYCLKSGTFGIPDQKAMNWVLFRAIPVVTAYHLLYRIFVRIERKAGEHNRT